jgi:hypothetical protein
MKAVLCIAVISCLGVHAGILDHWTSVQLSANHFGLDCVAFANGRYVAFGEYSDYGIIFSSEDGQTWTLRSDGGGTGGSGLSYSVGLVFTGGKFFALGGFGAHGVSVDGTNWTIFQGFGPNYNTAYGVAYGSSKYVAVGNNGQTASDFNISTSADGVNWVPQHSGSASTSTLSDVAYGAGKFVAIGSANDAGHTYTSTDGMTWTQGTIAGGNQISFIGTRFIVPYVAGTNLLSADGVTWVPVYTGLTNALWKASYANGLYISRAGASGGYFASSTDGRNWVQYPQSVPGATAQFPGFCVATDGSRLVTVSAVYRSGSVYFDGYIHFSDPLVQLSMTNSTPPSPVLCGLVGRSYRIESADVLSNGTATAWQPRTNLQLPSLAYVWTDPTAAAAQSRFYRAALLP